MLHPGTAGATAPSIPGLIPPSIPVVFMVVPPGSALNRAAVRLLEQLHEMSKRDACQRFKHGRSRRIKFRPQAVTLATVDSHGQPLTTTTRLVSVCFAFLLAGCTTTNGDIAIACVLGLTSLQNTATQQEVNGANRGRGVHCVRRPGKSSRGSVLQRVRRRNMQAAERRGTFVRPAAATGASPDKTMASPDKTEASASSPRRPATTPILGRPCPLYTAGTRGISALARGTSAAMRRTRSSGVISHVGSGTSSSS